jgi:hypothetical protein
MDLQPRAVLVIGVQASGKSTIGRLLAGRFQRGAFIEGDQLWQMVVAGRQDMSAAPSDEATRQLQLRYRHGALLATSFVQAGFTAVHVDNMYGPAVAAHLQSMAVARSLVVLCPRPDAVEQRELSRGSTAYAGWIGSGTTMIDAIRRFDGWLRETPPLGLWIDSSDLTPEQTVDRIIDRWPDTFVGDADQVVK